MLSLRSKLTLGFGGLLLVALALGVYGLVLLGRLGPAIDVILRENYRSVVAMQEAKEAIERMESSALYALLGYGASAREIQQENDPRFRRALAVELGNITLPGERARARRLKALYADYQRTLSKVLDTTRAVRARRELYFSTLRPLFTALKAEANAILQMNQENMAEASEAARMKAATARWRMLLLLLGGAVLAAGLTFFVSRLILKPVRRITSSAEEVRQGNLDVVVPVLSNDELGRLAESFNAMTTRLREIRRSDRARLLRVQRATQIAIDHFPDAVAILSPQGEVELANEAARKLFDLETGTKPTPENYFWLSQLLDEKAATRVVNQRCFDQAVQIFDDGEERFFLPQAVPIRDNDRMLAGVLYVLSDVTHLRRAYEMNASLLARIAHEINAPLTSLRMALDLLLEEKTGALRPKHIELLRAARDDADQLGRLSRDLFYLHHTPSEQARALTTEPVRPAEMAGAVLRRAKAAFEKKDVQVHADVPAHLPKIEVDPRRIEQVLEALLENALVHTPPGGIVHVAVTLAAGDRVRFTVSDTGIRIPEEQLANIFDRAYGAQGGQGDAAQRDDLRLLVTRDIIEAHGGRITAEHSLSRGTTFVFTLPRAGRTPVS